MYIQKNHTFTLYSFFCKYKKKYFYFLSLSLLSHTINLVTTIAPRDENPCVPSPCGPNSQCRVVGTQAACSCLPNYIGRAPNCRPECTTSNECPHNLACINERCESPCAGSCGINAECSVLNHNPICACYPGYEGDPLSICNPVVTCKTFFSSFVNNYYKVFQLLTN